MEMREMDELVRSQAIVLIPWQKIMPDKQQPRTYFATDRLEQLTGSVEESAQALPAVVRPLMQDPNFEYKIVDGERRWRAAKALDKPVPCIIKEFNDDEEVLFFQVLANDNREGHTPMETCEIIQRILATRRFMAMPKAQRMAAVGRFFGKTEIWVWQYLGLRRLHPDLKKRLNPGIPKKERIQVGLAVKLSGFDRDEQIKMFKMYRRRGLGYKGAVRLIDKINLKKGLHKHRKGRRPADEFEIALRFAQRVQTGAEGVLDLRDAEFEKMFASRDATQRKRFADELDMAVAAVDRIRQRTRAAFRAVPLPSAS